MVDHDKVSITNLNRQLIATHNTIDEYKVDVARKRILDINPTANIDIRRIFFMPESEDFFE